MIDGELLVEMSEEARLVILLWFCMESPGGSGGEESSCNAEDLGSIPGLGRSPEEGNGKPLQYSSLQSPVDRGIAQEVTKNQTWLSDQHFHLHGPWWLSHRHPGRQR